MYSRMMRNLFYIWISCLASILVACRLAPASGTSTQVAQISRAPLAGETSQLLSTTMPSSSPATREINTPTTTPIVSPSPLLSPTLAPHSTFPPLTPTLTGNLVDARLILAFFDAYDAGQFDAALALLDDHVQIGDCDFQANEPTEFHGKENVAIWLRQRIADHDQFIIREIEGTTVSSDGFSGAGADFSRRTSDTLKRLGYPDGITNNVGAKIVIAPDTKLILGIALGPGFHSTFTCYSYFGITP